MRAARCCGVVYGVPALQLRPWATVAITSWRATASGMVWHVLDTFVRQAHVGIDHETMRIMHQYLPPVDGNEESLPVVILAVQVLATIQHGHYVLTAWARRDGRPVPPYANLPAVLAPRIQPWLMEGFWNYNLWGLTVTIINRFLARPSLGSETDFLDSLQDVDVSAGQNPWVVTLIVFTAYVVALSPWAWPTVFRG